MLLYHGTTAKLLTQIREHGIMPRRVTGKSNWDKFESHDEMVYLTTAYPLYFALASSENGEALAIIEVDCDKLDDLKMYPDEDFVAQIILHQKKTTLEKAQEYVKHCLELYQKDWPESLRAMGTCCHRGTILPDTFTRIALFNIKERNPELIFSMLDPSITLVNYMIKGQYYRDFVSWVFSDREMLPQYDDAQKHAELLPDSERRTKFWERESFDRSGIEVTLLSS